MCCEQLGRTGLKISVVGIGSMNFGGSKDPSTANAIIDRALDAGVNVQSPVVTAATARPRMILDCDPGLDDAVAIAVALRWADVVGITTVGGNVGLEHATANALSLCDLLDRATYLYTPVTICR
jgi:Inosine-uridine preferring nucleoside hydrolase